MTLVTDTRDVVQALLMLVRPLFAATRLTVHVVKFVYMLWTQRNAPTVAVKQGVDSLVQVGRLVAVCCVVLRFVVVCFVVLQYVAVAM